MPGTSATDPEPAGYEQRNQHGDDGDEDGSNHLLTSYTAPDGPDRGMIVKGSDEKRGTCQAAR